MPSSGSIPPDIITIPSDDRTFREQVDRIHRAEPVGRPEDLEQRLRRLFPRVTVRERGLSGESPAWYVYRDGAWRAATAGPWWDASGLPQVSVSSEGWVTEANATARSLLGIEASDLGSLLYTDFLAPGTLDDAVALFAAVEEGRDLTTTVLLRPTSGEIVAVDIHASLEGSTYTGVLRLAEDVALTPSETPAMPAPDLVCLPADDVAFRGYAERILARMPEPTRDSLVLRLRRLYPHAQVVEEAGVWTATRDTESVDSPPEAWWHDDTLPLVRYDAEALILEANPAAQTLLGSRLVGHYWQEFVTPGSTEQVSEMLKILAEVGAAESRFRMPSADGSLVEFDSYTTVEGERFTTVMRPRA